MSQRINYPQVAADLYKKYLDFSAANRQSSIDATLRSLVDVRVSQINGCAFCVDMHSKEAKIHGERELRLYHLAIWHESPLFTPREKAALAWAEVLTRIPDKGVSDEAYAAAREQFDEKELTDLTYVVMAINGWNRLGVAFRSVPGSADTLYGLDKAGLS